MQPITREELEKIIAEAKAEGKDTTQLEELLLQPLALFEIPPELGGTKKVGKRWIISTGPANEEDFK